MKLNRKGKLLFPIAAAAAALLAYGLWPLTTKKWDITFDREMIDYKSEFIDRITREQPVAALPWTQEPPPNIVIITADDLGKTDMSFYGGDTVDTPRMDQLCSDGVSFTDAYCSAPISSPSRAGLLTGRYQQRYGMEVQPQNRYGTNRLELLIARLFYESGGWFVVDNMGTPRKSERKKQGLPPTEITLPEILQASGYSTGITGKWHLGHNEPFIPNNRGFDYQYGFYEAFSLYAPTGTENIVEYRHDYYANKHIWKQERKGPCAITENDREIEEKEYLTFRIAEEANSFISENRGDPFFLYVPFSAPHTPFQAPKEYVQRFSHVEDMNKRVYYAMIAALDDAVGSIIDHLDAEGLTDNTLILFCSDNGGATYTGATDNYPLKGGKFMYFEGGINVPAAMIWKGKITPGQTYDQPVSLLDFFSTAAAAAGVPLPDERIYDGIDLMPYVTGKVEGAPHEAIFWRAAYNKVVRRDNWKLILDEKNGIELLFDLASDREERNDLSREHPDVVDELKSLLDTWEENLMDPLWPRVMDYRAVIDGEEYEFAL